MSNTSSWYTKAQAADRLQVSTKTIEKLAAAGKIEQHSSKRPGKPAIAVYHPADVERLRKERHPEAAPFIMPDETREPESQAGAVIRRVESVPPPVMALLEALSRPAAAPTGPPRMYLTVKEASEVSGLTETFLRRQIHSGKLAAVKDRGWKIRRSALEHFSEGSEASEK